MPCKPSRPAWRARRPASASLVAVLVTLGLSVAACTTVAPTKGVSPPSVLGQQKGTPAATGQPAPRGTGQLDAVSCVGPGHCWAVGSPGPGAPGAATTGTTTTSTATTTPPPATVIDATVNGGKTWVAQPLTLTAAPALTGISCPTVQLCMAVGLSGSDAAGIVLTTQLGGSVWGEGAIPAGATVITSVECASAVDCTVIASDGTTFWSAHSANFGRSWQRGGTLPAGLEDAGALSCVTGGPCLVTGFTTTTSGHGQGAIVLSNDRGATWTAANVPTGTGLLQGAVCATVTSCLAAGTTSTTVSAVVPAKGQVLTSQDGGQTWNLNPSTSSIDDVFGIDCPTPRLCAMVGTEWVGHPAIGSGGVAQSRDSGLSFTASTTAYTPLPLTAVDCFSARACVAVGGNTVVSIALSKAKPSRSATTTTPPGGHHRPGLNGVR